MVNIRSTIHAIVITNNELLSYLNGSLFFIKKNALFYIKRKLFDLFFEEFSQQIW